MTSLHYLIAVALAAVLAVLPTIGHAEDEFCASVYPCNSEGELLEQYRDIPGFCGTHYRAQCERARIQQRSQCQDLSGAYEQLQEKFDMAQEKAMRAKRSLRRLKRSLR